MIKKLFLIISFFLVLVGIIFFARGYRFNIEKKKIVTNGIAIISSYPSGAQVFIDGVLKGATNSNITLEAGTYQIEIKKEGYTTWKDRVLIKGEVVTKIDALLYPLNPSLMPITSIGIRRAFWSENTDRIIIYSSSDESNEKNGLYALDISKKTLSIFNPMRLLLSEKVLPQGFSHDDVFVDFAPDSREILVEIKGLAAYLIPIDSETSNPIDVLRSIDVIRSQWASLRERKTQRLLQMLKQPLQQIASDSFKFVSYSPDETKFIYFSSQSTNVPRIINPPLIGSNYTQENRFVMKDYLYVYDIKEDKNYPLFLDSKHVTRTDLNNLTIIWYVDSQHIVIQKTKQIIIMNYDSKHSQTIYSGPFESNFMSVGGDGRILILTNLNPDSNPEPDMYAIGIR